jgi:Oxidoreductase family, NAD-binding Rossmann fold
VLRGEFVQEPANETVPGTVKRSGGSTVGLLRGRQSCGQPVRPSSRPSCPPPASSQSYHLVFPHPVNRVILSAFPSGKIRIGYIGCGNVSGSYLPNLTSNPHVEVVSVCDIILERAKKRSQQFKVPNLYPNVDELLAGVPFDLLVNTTSMPSHGPGGALVLPPVYLSARFCTRRFRKATGP